MTGGAGFFACFGAAFLATFFFLAGAAAFFFFTSFFFAFAFFFAMIVLPISAAGTVSRRPPMGLECAARSGRRLTRSGGGLHRRPRLKLPEPRRTRTPRGPIYQLDRMHGWKLRAGADLRDAADVACCNHIRSQFLDSPDFAFAQPSCVVWLQNIVGAG